MKNEFITVPAKAWHLHYTLLVDWEVGMSVAELFGLKNAEPDDSFFVEYEARMPSRDQVKVMFTSEDIQFAISTEGKLMCFGVCSPASNLPAFRFSEVLSICDLMDGEDSLKNAFLLLLAPACNDDDLTDMARLRDKLRMAWANIAPNPKVQLIDQIVDATCRASVQWRCDPVVGWVNNGSYSYRNPKRPTSLPQSHFLKLKTFFDSIDGEGKRVQST